MCMSSVTQLCLTLCDPIGSSPPGSSLSMGLPRQEYWSGLQLPSPGELPNPGVEPPSLASPALVGGFFNTSTNWEANIIHPTLMLDNKVKFSYLKHVLLISRNICILRQDFHLIFNTGKNNTI